MWKNPRGPPTQPPRSAWSGKGLATPRNSPTNILARAPPGPVNAGRRRQTSLVEKQLETIHPNPGPTRRGKTKRSTQGKAERNKRRMAKRRGRRKATKKPIVPIVTWNLQGISMRERNRARLKNTIGYITKQGWEITMLSEIRADRMGVIWMGAGEETTAVIHSLRCGVILRGSARDEWNRGKQQMDFRERAVSIQIGKLSLISVYQPVSTHGEAAIEKYRNDVEDLMSRTPKGNLLIIGGDHNSQIGKQSARTGVAGKWGLGTYTNRQGHDLLNWCEENHLAWVNSFSKHPQRGTWWHRTQKKWYELDGFIMRQEQRHRHLVSMRVMNEMSLSDHKPVIIRVKTKMKKWRASVKPMPNIKWETLRTGAAKEEFRRKTAALIEDEEIGKSRGWTEISNILVKTAKAVCGVQPKTVENPWTIGFEEELGEIRQEINKWWEARRKATNPITSRIFQTKLKRSRRRMKRRLRDLEREWWDERIAECEDAARRGDFGAMHSVLRKLGTRKSKPQAGHKITTEQFRAHFSKISEQRFENTPEEIQNAVELTTDRSQEISLTEANEELNATPSAEEILQAMEEVNDSAPGSDKVRMRYIREACAEIRWNVVELVQHMFETRADKWEELIKVGQIVPLFTKGDRDNPGNYRGVCLLAMVSRILARVLAKRLRAWTEKHNILDNNQSGFRPGQSTADATQVIMRIQEDMRYIRARRTAMGLPGNGKEPEGRLLDLEKAYPRVSKPALWQFLQRHALQGNFLNTLKDLHEATAYVIKGKTGDSESWIPQRGLREGCPTSPVLFNIFHQMVIRVAERNRQSKSGNPVGIPWNHVEQSKLPGPNQFGKFNSECTRTHLTMSLFADDTTILGTTDEMETGCAAIKETMQMFEERNNASKEEKLVFGDSQSADTRMLGCWVDPKIDTRRRISRAAKLWARVKPQLMKSRLSKRQQALIIQACVETGLLFDATTRSWHKSEIKSMQSWIERAYRYVWSNKREAPLKTMEKTHTNMQDVRNSLGITSLQIKIEQRSLQRIGHVLRMGNDKPAKRAVCGWLPEMEEVANERTKIRTTPHYWRKLVKEAGIDPTNLDTLTANRKEWREIIKKRTNRVERWERSHGNREAPAEFPRNTEVARRDLTCPECQKACKSAGGLSIHIKRIHRQPRNQFLCPTCQKEFNSENTMKNHAKRCQGERRVGGLVQCKQCGAWITATNFARHRKRCCPNQSRSPNPRTYKVKYVECPQCTFPQAATNLARHLRTCRNRRGESVPSARG